MLLEVPHERVTIMEELGRGAFGRVYKSVMRGVPEKNTFSKPKDHSLDSHEGRIVATKVLPGAWIQNIWQKHNLLFQQTLFTRVILIDNRQERLSCNRFELFNPIDSKHYIYRGKQHLNAPVGNSDVPQGPIFDLKFCLFCFLILYIIYINDLPERLQFTTRFICNESIQ